MQPQRTRYRAFRLIGLETRTSNDREADPSSAQIPSLWHRYWSEGAAHLIPGRTSGSSVIGAYTQYASDYRGDYSLVVGTEVKSLAEVPAGMVGLEVPEAEYVVFTVDGPLPEALIDAWLQIAGFFGQRGALKRAYTTDFEVHYYAQGERPKIDIYVAIRGDSPAT
jgi:predicted transcriptional regulator YdeE